MGSTVINPNATELTADRSADNVQTVIRAVDRQVLGRFPSISCVV